MLAGPLVYETLHKNMECVIPSLSTINKSIAKKTNTIIEGVLQTRELSIYLRERNCPLVVSLSEDATRITGRVQYDARTNQLSGFVLLIDANKGMPIPFSFHARNAFEIYKHFTDSNVVAQFVNVVMAKPLCEVPAFCLLLFSSDGKYTSEDVSNRWKYIEKQLRKENITIISMSADSDPRYNTAMKKCMFLGEDSILFDNASWFKSSGNTPSLPPFFVQDTIYIATKLRSLLLKTLTKTKRLPLGKYFVSISHLIAILKNFPRDQHQLTWTTLNPIDKQNFDSVVRICDRRVIDLLESNVKDSEATVLFLEILQNVISSYSDIDLPPLERVRKIWYVVFVLRLWRRSIMARKINLKDNFITSNCYSCIEMNAHSLIRIILFAKKNDLTEAFLPYLLNSQHCEAFSRQIRSFTTTYSTVANCTVKEMVGRITKIQLLNDIPLMGKKIQFPRTVKTPIKNAYSLPNQNEILETIEICKKVAIKFATNFGLLSKQQFCGNIFECSIEPSKVKKNAEKACRKKW